MSLLPNESQLIRKAQQGDEASFSQLMTHYEKSIFNLTYRMVNSIEDAEELTQTTFLKAWNSLNSFHSDSSFFTWLYRLAKNSSIDYLRQKKRRTAVLDTLPVDDLQNNVQLASSATNPEKIVLQHDRLNTLYEAIGSLSDDHRDILLQREMDGLSYEEIAQLRSISIGTVKSRISRARLSLRNILKSKGNYFSSSSSKDTETTTQGGDAP